MGGDSRIPRQARTSDPRRTPTARSISAGSRNVECARCGARPQERHRVRSGRRPAGYDERRYARSIRFPSVIAFAGIISSTYNRSTYIKGSQFMTQFTSVQSEFVESVLNLKPAVATFDCDGTLWSGDAGEGFFRWELENKFVSEDVVRWARARYADYRAGKVAEDVMCGEMVSMHRGLHEEIVQQACDAYFARAIAPGIFPEMRELVQRLRASGCDVWAVSSSSQWIIRSAMRSFGIPQNRILSAEVAVENDIITY